MLSIMRQPWDDPVFRLLLAAPNGAMMLSETVTRAGWGPFRPGEHFAMADLEQLPEVATHYLTWPDERNRIATSLRQMARTELSMETMARQVLSISGLLD